ncbi:hypothetical protein [Candidatus Clavichlamydia salmonicola]|uniref:hypothetical protein n=1 Tax=Candidatus Clavichlamydia salmonicola TaxID=469812 RepID=UPI001891DA8F|nr:hypothetical protein [Candidatus Clavichlamydia salmonicola]
MRSFKCSLLIKVCFASFLILGVSSFASSDRSLIDLCASTHNENANKIDKKEKNENKEEKGFLRFWRRNRKEQKKKSPATIKTYSTTRKSGQFLDNISAEMDPIQEAQKNTTSAFFNNRPQENIVVAGAFIEKSCPEHQLFSRTYSQSDVKRKGAVKVSKKGARSSRYVYRNRKAVESKANEGVWNNFNLSSIINFLQRRTDGEKTKSVSRRSRCYHQYKRLGIIDDQGVIIKVHGAALGHNEELVQTEDSEDIWEIEDEDGELETSHHNRMTFLSQSKAHAVQQRTLSEEEEVDQYEDENSFIEEDESSTEQLSHKVEETKSIPVSVKKTDKEAHSETKENKKSLISRFLNALKSKLGGAKKEKTKDISLAGLYYYEDLETRDSQRSIQQQLEGNQSVNITKENTTSFQQEISCVYCKKSFYAIDIQSQKIGNQECPACGYKSLLVKKYYVPRKEDALQDEQKANCPINVMQEHVSQKDKTLKPRLLKEREKKMFPEYKEPNTGLLFSKKMIETSQFNPLMMTISDNQSVKLEGEVPPSHHWSRFDFKESGFSISLPLKPEHSKQIIEIANPETKIFYETYISEPSVDAVYVISVWEYPANIKIKDPEANLQEGFSGMLLALPDSRVLLMKSKEVQGFHALEFHVKNAGLMFKGELISMDNILYQIFTVYKDSGKQAATAKKDYEHFINSFKITHMHKKNALSLHSGKVKL